jgi:hypothetical protein
MAKHFTNIKYDVWTKIALRQRLKPLFWGGWAQCPTSNMEKLKKFDREVVFAQNLKNPK